MVAAQRQTLWVLRAVAVAAVLFLAARLLESLATASASVVVAHQTQTAGTPRSLASRLLAVGRVELLPAA